MQNLGPRNVPQAKSAAKSKKAIGALAVSGSLERFEDRVKRGGLFNLRPNHTAYLRAQRNFRFLYFPKYWVLAVFIEQKVE